MLPPLQPHRTTRGAVSNKKGDTTYAVTTSPRAGPPKLARLEDHFHAHSGACLARGKGLLKHNIRVYGTECCHRRSHLQAMQAALCLTRVSRTQLSPYTTLSAAQVKHTERKWPQFVAPREVSRVRWRENRLACCAAQHNKEPRRDIRKPRCKSKRLAWHLGA